jgi:hypothetical protein
VYDPEKKASGTFGCQNIISPDFLMGPPAAFPGVGDAAGGPVGGVVWVVWCVGALGRLKKLSEGETRGVALRWDEKSIPKSSREWEPSKSGPCPSAFFVQTKPPAVRVSVRFVVFALPGTCSLRSHTESKRVLFLCVWW